jgi:AraC family transcriptional regulator
MDRGSSRQSASAVDPESIQQRADAAQGVELLVRRRAPGSVELSDGHREHLLMCTTGHPLGDAPVESTLETRDSTFQWQSCPRRHVTFLPAGFPISWSWSYASDSVHLTLPPAFLDQITADEEDVPAVPPAPFFRTLDDTLARLLDELRLEIGHGAPGRDLAVSSLLTLLGVRLARRHRPSAAPAATAAPEGLSQFQRQQAIQRLHDELDKRIPLAALAAESGLSPFHFARLFKQATGLPPHEYQLQLRIQRARELLQRESDRTLAEIACELGFADESHFRRHFKRIVGTTPGRFRRQQ